MVDTGGPKFRVNPTFFHLCSLRTQQSYVWSNPCPFFPGLDLVDPVVPSLERIILFFASVHFVTRWSHIWVTASLFFILVPGGHGGPKFRGESYFLPAVKQAGQSVIWNLCSSSSSSCWDNWVVTIKTHEIFLTPTFFLLKLFNYGEKSSNSIKNNEITAQAITGFPFSLFCSCAPYEPGGPMFRANPTISCSFVPCGPSGPIFE